MYPFSVDGRGKHVQGVLSLQTERQLLCSTGGDTCHILSGKHAILFSSSVSNQEKWECWDRDLIRGLALSFMFSKTPPVDVVF